MICVAIKGPSYNDASAQIAQVLPYADIVELRLDLFETINSEALQQLMHAYKIPMIFTIRSLQQGGHYPYSEEKRLKDIEKVAHLNPAYLDLEYNTSQPFITQIAQQHPQIKLILSYHNFEEIPHNLENMHKIMQTIPAHWYKIAVHARNAVEALKLLQWGATKSNTIMVCMGEAGQFTRALAPIFNSPLTYASVDDSLTTAPGQLSAKQLVDVFNYKSLTPQTQIYALIGNPVDKSPSAHTHNHVFKKWGLNAVYIKIPLEPFQLKSFLLLAQQLPIQGLSVTMPLKENILLLIPSPAEASSMGAVNTLKLGKGTFEGFNTDGMGALNALEKHTPVKGKHIVIIGAGGTAKAILYEALKRHAKVTIVNRTLEKAKQLAEQYGCSYAGLGEFAQQGYDIIINTTPESMPIHPKDLLSKTTAMDVKTIPQYSDFLTHASSLQCTVVFGYEMFIEQALGQFAIWFDSALPESDCRELLLEKVSEFLKL